MVHQALCEEFGKYKLAVHDGTKQKQQYDYCLHAEKSRINLRSLQWNDLDLNSFFPKYIKV